MVNNQGPLFSLLILGVWLAIGFHHVLMGHLRGLITRTELRMSRCSFLSFSNSSVGPRDGKTIQLPEKPKRNWVFSGQVVIISQNGINETCKHYSLTTRKDMKPVNRGYEKGYIPVSYAFISKETPQGYNGYDGWLPVNV